MSNIELKAPSDDMTAEERESLKNYMDNGMPGLTRVQESDIFQWFKLYMSGKTYNEIAESTKTKKDLILYMSYKQDWVGKRHEHYNELLQNMIHKMSQAKLQSVNTITKMISALAKYYGDMFDQFLKNNDKSVIEGIDTKMLSQYYKSMEVLEKLVTPPKTRPDDGDESRPNININMGSGTVKQIDDKTLEVDDNTAEKILLALAAKKKDSEE